MLTLTFPVGSLQTKHSEDRMNTFRKDNCKYFKYQYLVYDDVLQKKGN